MERRDFLKIAFGVAAGAAAFAASVQAAPLAPRPLTGDGRLPAGPDAHPLSRRAMKSITSSRRKCTGTGTGAGVVATGVGDAATGAIATGAAATGVVTIGAVAIGEPPAITGMSAGVTARRRDPSFNKTKAPRERGFLVCAWNHAQ
jgi:hypothetical protein